MHRAILLTLALFACQKPIDQDADGFTNDVDCNDLDPNVNPGAAEVCNGIDDDCSFAIDDGATDATTGYQDRDSDGFGDGALPTTTCELPVGYVANNLDCDDTSPRYSPAAAETDCTDPEDYNCDGSAGAVDNDNDGFFACEECDDAAKDTYPGADEVCDDADNDCDFQVDEDAVDATIWYQDGDGDGYGVERLSEAACDRPSGHAPVFGDCDDNDATYHPGAAEVDCTDPEDYNCDGSVGFADADEDGWAACEDCDDKDAKKSPDDLEVCDDKDNDCDGRIDDDALDASTWYRDADKDGYGDLSTTSDACDVPTGYTADFRDCDDKDSTTYPDAPETCDDDDNDCDGTIDEDATDATIWYADLDGDGAYGDTITVEDCDAPSGYGTKATDCDDVDSTSFPGASELCDDRDNDCDGATDESAIDTTTFYKDGDGDAYGDPKSTTKACDLPTGYVANDDDCLDSDKTAYPGAVETCDKVDDDCDGTVDDNATDATTFYADLDKDGAYGDAATTKACDAPAGYGTYTSATKDCDDLDVSAYPGAKEVCDDVDDDCDGSVDESAVDTTTWYADADGDKFGNPLKSSAACDAPTGYVADKTDCDDTSSYSHPGALEFCDKADNDCDGESDESDAYDAADWWADADKDGYGKSGSSATHACAAPTGYVDNDDDCNDTKSTISPRATEFCNSVDDNCDGVTDGSDAADAEVYYADADADGYGDPDAPKTLCAITSGYVDDSTDCEDGDATAYLNSRSEEVPKDGIDQDCDGTDTCTDLDCDGIADLVFWSHHDGDYTTTSTGYFSGGDTTFSSSDRWDFSTTAPLYNEVYDIDQDGYQDILMNNYCGNATCSVYAAKSAIYWGSASGYSTSDRTQLSTVGAYANCIGDLDADGYNDVVMTGYHNGSTYLLNQTVFWGSKAGWSDSDTTTLPAYGVEKCYINDFDADGDEDLYFQSYYDGDYTTNSRVFWNTAGAFSTTDYDDLPGFGTEDSDIADFNNDGYLDIAFADYYDGDYFATSYVYYGSSSGYSTTKRNSLTMYGPQEVASADLNSDGYLDLVFANHYDGDYYVSSYIYWGSSSGFSDSNRYTLNMYGARDIEILDLDKDGYLDLLFGQYYDGDYAVSQTTWFGSKTGYSTSNIMSLPGYGVVNLDVRDIDDDGYSDILYGAYYDGDYYADSYLYWGSAKGWSTASVTTFSGYGSWHNAIVGG